MKFLFRGFYRAEKAELEEAWTNGIFILDTSVLLNMYRYKQKARDDLFGVLEAVKDRVWIPYHVGLEFQRNRLTVISEQRRRYGDVRKAISEVIPNLEKNFHELQVRNRHSIIDPDPLITQIKSVLDLFVTGLADAEYKQLDVDKLDDIRDRIDRLLADRIGAQPTSDWIANLTKEAEKRYQMRQPPGFQDERKGDFKEASFAYGGVTYMNKLGDLIIWKQIIDHAKTAPDSHIVFVTDDSKDDWWWTIDSQGKKRVGPRPELVDEITRDGAAKSFYMYSSLRFIQYAGDYLGGKIEPDTVEEVRRVNSSDNNTQRKLLAYGDLRPIMANWIRENYDFQTLDDKLFIPDFSITLHDTGEIIGFEISDCTDYHKVSQKVSATIDQIKEFATKEFSVYCVVVVEQFSEKVDRRQMHEIKSAVRNSSINVSVIMGKLAVSFDGRISYENYEFIE